MARKIQPRSKTPKPTPGQSSEDYWRERETRQRAANIHDEARFAARINDIFQSTQDSIQQEIESFYQRYARKEGIDIAEARRRVSKIDMEKYERLAAQYVKAAHEGGREAAFSDIANEQMRLYNATMRINRLEMLKARCGIRAMEGYRLADQLINEALEERTYSEYYRLAGILGNTVQFNENMVRSIANASYQNATWSQRLWNNQALLSERIGAQIAQGILAGKGSDVLARNIQKLTGQSTFVCQRLMRTELRRVQTAAAEQSMKDNGVTEYKFMVANGVNPCDECLSMDGQVFKLSEMAVGKNAPPIHPSCHCCTAPYVDEAKWQRWLDGPAQAGVPWAEFEVEYSNKGLAASGVNGNVEPHDPPEFIRNVLDTEDRQKILSDYEDLIVDSPIENAIIITKDGKLYHCYGTLNGVYPDVDLGEELRGADMTHNHPKGSSNEWSFSEADRSLYFKYELNILRGVDEYFEYEFSRNKDDIDELAVSVFDLDEYSSRHQKVIDQAMTYGIGYRRKRRG